MNTAVRDLRPMRIRDAIKVWAIWVGSIIAMITVLLLASLLGAIGLWWLFLRRGWSWRDLGFVPLTRRG